MGELRLRTLENIVQEKAQIIIQQQQELEQFTQQHGRLTMHLEEKAGMIADYEDKFLKVKEIMQQKEINISDLRATVANQEELLSSKQ